MFKCHICGKPVTHPGNECTEFRLCDRCQKWVWGYIYEDSLTLKSAIKHCSMLHEGYEEDRKRKTKSA